MPPLAIDRWNFNLLIMIMKFYFRLFVTQGELEQRHVIVDYASKYQHVASLAKALLWQRRWSILHGF